MQLNNVNLAVLIKGRVATEYVSPMDYQTYIEGRDGSEFELEIHNRNPFDIEAIVSIDGLSIIDGKPAGIASSGYLVRANERMAIPGWKVDGSTAAKFQFAGEKGGSYVEQIGGDTLNKGVIGIKAFAPKSQANHLVFRSSGHNMNSRSYPKGARGMSPMLGSATLNHSSASYSSNAATASYTADSMMGGQLETSTYKAFDTEAVTQSLGTEFGAATNFATTEVSFERGDLQAMMWLNYDDRQGLKRRGIDVSRPKPRPNPFPADVVGCTPPAGWNK